MKNLFKVFIISIIIGCSDSNNDDKPVQIPVPVAVADSYETNQNTLLIIDNLFKNDKTQETTELSFIDKSTSKKGSVVKNSNGTFTYIPKKEFSGKDTFTYTICNGKTNEYCSTTTVTVKVFPKSEKFNIPISLTKYYKNISFSTDKDANKRNLKQIIENYTVLSYGSRHKYLYKADADLNKPDNVTLIYTGESRYWKEYQSSNNNHSTQTFNTEHVYPKSKLTSSDAVTDFHHLRVCDAKINSKRSNHPFIDGTGKNKLVAGNKWYPGDRWKGDVARMIFYLNLVHGETFDKVGSLELFLKWNIEDPVSKFEIQRNNKIQKTQKNRNPFIDNPYLVTLIYGGGNANNKWK